MTEKLSNLPPQSYFDEQDALALLVPRAKVLAALADACGQPGAAVLLARPAAPVLEAPAAQDLPADEFRGDTPSLVRNIIALLQLDADGALVPHGVGGHARGLLSAAAARLAAAPQAPAAPTEPGRLDDGMQIRCRKCGEWATIAYNSARIVTHNKHTGKPRDERDIASDPEGRLIVAPGPLPAATVAEPAAPAGDALQELDPGLSREVYRACEDLPEGWSIRIDLENGYGGVKLIDPDGEENELPVDGWLSNAMRESIAAAQAAAKGSQS